MKQSAQDETQQDIPELTAPKAEKAIDISPATRDDSGDDAPPAMISPTRGPMDQIVPDVPTGSTPLTRHDD